MRRKKSIICNSNRNYAILSQVYRTRHLGEMKTSTNDDNKWPSRHSTIFLKWWTVTLNLHSVHDIDDKSVTYLKIEAFILKYILIYIINVHILHTTLISWISCLLLFCNFYHTNLNCKSWYIRATVARVPYRKVLTLLNGSVQTMHR